MRCYLFLYENRRDCVCVPFSSLNTDFVYINSIFYIFPSLSLNLDSGGRFFNKLDKSVLSRLKFDFLIEDTNNEVYFFSTFLVMRASFYNDGLGVNLQFYDSVCNRVLSSINVKSESVGVSVGGSASVSVSVNSQDGYSSNNLDTCFNSGDLVRLVNSVSVMDKDIEVNTSFFDFKKYLNKFYFSSLLDFFRDLSVGGTLVEGDFEENRRSVRLGFFVGGKLNYLSIQDLVDRAVKVVLDVDSVKGFNYSKEVNLLSVKDTVFGYWDIESGAYKTAQVPYSDNNLGKSYSYGGIDSNDFGGANQYDRVRRIIELSFKEVMLISIPSFFRPLFTAGDKIILKSSVGGKGEEFAGSYLVLYHYMVKGSSFLNIYIIGRL